jgi:hypothetical protein
MVRYNTNESRPSAAMEPEMNLDTQPSDRFGQALFNALLDGFERAKRETHLAEASHLAIGVTAAHPSQEVPVDGMERSQ